MKIKFKHFLRESVQQEVSKMDMRMEDIFDIYLTYDDVTEFLDKELRNRKVTVSRLFIYKPDPGGYDEKEYLSDVTIDVDFIKLGARNLIFVFIDKDGTNYYVPDNARLKWEKPITRNITELDPYGEEENDEE